MVAPETFGSVHFYKPHQAMATAVFDTSPTPPQQVSSQDAGKSEGGRDFGHCFARGSNQLWTGCAGKRRQPGRAACAPQHFRHVANWVGGMVGGARRDGVPNIANADTLELAGYGPAGCPVLKPELGSRIRTHMRAPKPGGPPVWGGEGPAPPARPGCGPAPRGRSNEMAPWNPPCRFC